MSAASWWRVEFVDVSTGKIWRHAAYADRAFAELIAEQHVGKRAGMAVCLREIDAPRCDLEARP